MAAAGTHAKAANQKPPFGWKEDGSHAYEPYRPPVVEFASDCVRAGCMAEQGVPYEKSIPLPSGMKLSKAKNQLLLAVTDINALRFRRVYGYIGEIKYLQEADSNGDLLPITVETPAMVQDVTKLRWRYGSLREEAYGSCLFCRVVAFTSTAAFSEPSVVLAVGGPISGLIEATRGDHLDELLSAWCPVSAAEWKLRSLRTFPDSGIELNGDAVASLPALTRTNFPNYHLPNVPYARLYGPRKPKYFEPFSNDPDAKATASRVRCRSSSPKNPPGRRMRDRFYAMQALQASQNIAAAASLTNTAGRAKAPPACSVPIHCCLILCLGW